MLASRGRIICIQNPMYELTCIINPMLEKSDAEATVAKIRDFIAGLGGMLKKEELREKRRLAYPIKKQLAGYYAVAQFELEKEKAEELQKELRMNNNILRYLMLELRESELAPAKPRKARLKAVTPKIAIEGEPVKKEKVKIEDLDKKLEEILKE